MSTARVSIPVHARTKKSFGFGLYGSYDTFEKAAEVVHRLRRDERFAWAFIPDEYAKYAKDRS